MKKNNCILLFLVFGWIMLLSSFQSMAQDTAFKVIAGSGTVQVKCDEGWKPLPVGATLTTKQTIKIEKDGYLGLVHSSGKTLALKKPDTYEVQHLNAQYSSTKSQAATKYADLYTQKIQGSSAPIAANPAPPLASTAVAERAIQTHKLKVLLPSSVDVFSSKVILRWNTKDTLVRHYEVVFKNMFEDVIMVKETDDTHIVLDFTDKAIAQEKLVIVSVNAKQQKDVQSSSYGIKHMTPEEAKPIEKELKALKLEIPERENALNQLLLASFYEQNNLLADALTHYDYAVSLAPGIKAFKTAYEQFLSRNGLGY